MAAPVMPSAASNALSSLASDTTPILAMLVSSELLEAAESAQLGEAELAACVLLVSILLGGLPRALYNLEHQFIKSRPGTPPLGIIGFIANITNLFTRTALAVLVNLVARLVTSTVPSRAVRVLTLLTTAMLFLYLQSGMRIGGVGKRE